MAKTVRKGKGGELNYVKRKGKEFLPQHPEPELACNVETKTEPCYYTGENKKN